MTPSARSDVPPFMVMDVMSAAAKIEAAGGHVIHMEVGQPFASGAADRDRGGAAALDGRIAYTEALGIPSLRARIARHYKETPWLDLDPERVIVTTGSSAGFILAFLAMFEAGARVGIANPGYPPYRHILTALGCEPVLIETNAETRWAVTPETLLAVHAKTPLDGVLIASPGQSDRHHDDAGGACRRSFARRKTAASSSSPTRSITASIMRSRPRRRCAFPSARW